MDKYERGAEIGKGGYGVVHEGVNKVTGQRVAIKCMDKHKLNAKEVAQVHDEVQILFKVDHPNVIKILDFHEDDKVFYIITELCEGGELLQRIVDRESYTERDAQAVLRSLLSALVKCHAMKIVHRDVKPENILFLTKAEDAPAKLADFGFAAEIEENLLDTSLGTPWYVCPEIVEKKPYDAAVDMWSFGVVMYVLLCGQLPFFHESNPELFKLIIRCDYGFDSPFWDNISELAKDLIRSLLVYDPKKRLTAEEVSKHPWILADLPVTDITPAIHELRRLLAKRRLRRGLQVAVTISRMKHMTEEVAANKKD